MVVDRSAKWKGVINQPEDVANATRMAVALVCVLTLGVRSTPSPTLSVMRMVAARNASDQAVATGLSSWVERYASDTGKRVAEWEISISGPIRVRGPAIGSGIFLVIYFLYIGSGF